MEARTVDDSLVELASSFDYLMAVTPTNTDQAYQAFEAVGFREPPAFHYRDLPRELDGLRARLAALPLDAVDDPALAGLYTGKRDELDAQTELVAARGTPDFLPLSIELYGGADDDLFELAQRLLAAVEPESTAPAASVDAATLADRARGELARLGAADRAGVEVRDDVPSLIVTGAHLLVGSGYTLPVERVDAMVQHEVGTHVVTHLNGVDQPVRLLGHGLAGYEQLQEGLAVFAEWLVGGLTPGRLRTLAARVVAVRRVVERVGFAEAFHELHGYGFPTTQAFDITARAHRSGGLTKDALYLRGLADLLAYLAEGGDLGLLTIGKLQLDQVPVCADLLARGVLRQPTLTPAWLDRPEAVRRAWLAQSAEDPLGLLDKR